MGRPAEGLEVLLARSALPAGRLQHLLVLLLPHALAALLDTCISLYPCAVAPLGDSFRGVRGERWPGSRGPSFLGGARNDRGQPAGGHQRRKGQSASRPAKRVPAASSPESAGWVPVEARNGERPGVPRN